VARERGPSEHATARRKRVPNFAAALARTADGWSAYDLDVTDAKDVEALGERLRDLDGQADTTLLFVEEEDQYFAVVRVDADSEDVRVFVSDAATALQDQPFGTMLVEETGVPEPPDPEDDADTVADDGLIPTGDADLLADLGTSAGELAELVAHEGMLPGDVVSELAARAGCGEELDALREA
jgi:putative tRNA adenosine deaminase-associated protein